MTTAIFTTPKRQKSVLFSTFPLSDYGVYFIPNSTNHLYYDTVPTYYLDVVCNDGTTDSSVKLFQVDIVPNEEPVPTIPGIRILPRGNTLRRGWGFIST